MDTMAVANERSNQYQSFEMGGEVTAIDVLTLFTEKIGFSGPFTLIQEHGLYIPGDDFTSHSIDPDRQVIIYDMYGSHGIIRPDPRFDFLSEVRDWIDEALEPAGVGEYAIGQVITPEDLA